MRNLEDKPEAKFPDSMMYWTADKSCNGYSWNAIIKFACLHFSSSLSNVPVRPMPP